MSTPSAYWRKIPRRSVLLFLLGVFFVFSLMGFAYDIMNLGRAPALYLELSVLQFGVFAVVYALAGVMLRGKFWMAFIPVFLLQQLLMNVLQRLFTWPPKPSVLNAADLANLQGRLTFDGYAAILAMALGYVSFVSVGVSEARRYFRAHAEMELAAEIHGVLVPRIDAKLAGFEFFGRSMASGEVGGDLIDLAGSEDRWVAYVADVSGHGVAPGVVMGMVKSAARMLISSGESSERLLPRLNEVLFPLKKPDMFVTLCFIAREGETLRVGLAGHPSILHFSPRTSDVAKLDCPNMPLGILPSGEFECAELRAEPGSLFALYTDGLLETANAAGEEFGSKRLEMELQKHGRQPLEAIYQSVANSVARHGAQFDDQSLLLARRI